MEDAPFNRGRGNHRRGSALSRGGNRGRGFRGKNTLQNVDTLTRSPPVYFLDSAFVHIDHDDQPHSVVITNLPPLRPQDCISFTSFIAECTSHPIKKVLFKQHCEKSGSLAAVCVFEMGNGIDIIQKLHGQVFLDHHLLVEQFLEVCFQFLTENCIKVTNLSSKVTEENLWKMFESCGQLGMIYLNWKKSDDSMEALVNFEDPKSLVNALKLDDTNIEESQIKVQKLDQALSAYINLLDHPDSFLKDLNVTHINYVLGGFQSGYVYFSDEESYLKALDWNGKELGGQEIFVKPRCELYLFDPTNCVNYEHISVVFSGIKILPHPRKYGVIVLIFNSQEHFENASKASQILLLNKPFPLYHSVSKIPSTLAQEESIDVHKNGKDNEEAEEPDEHTDEVVVSKSPKSLKKRQKKKSSATGIKRKRKNSTSSTGKRKVRKGNQ